MTARREIADQMAESAQSLLDALDDHQRARLQLPFPSDDERKLWYYTPTDHGGLALSEMSADQHRRVHRLVASGLSTAGYVTVAAIIGLENVLDHTEGWQASFGRERGRDPLLYSTTIFGSPGDDVWGWRFGGHHVSLHYTVIDGEVAATTPNFLGADPASSPLLGPHLHRPLAGTEDLARELMHALDQTQLAEAMVSPSAPTDLIGANRTRLKGGDGVVPLPLLFRGRLAEPFDELMATAQQAADVKAGLTAIDVEALSFSTTPKGLSASAFSTDQQEILRALLGTYVNRLPDGLADLELAKLSGDRLEELSLVWAGGLAAGEPHYYRVQSSALLVEYDNTQRDVNHVHTVWRDLTNDFGGDALADHYRTGHSHL